MERHQVIDVTRLQPRMRRLDSCADPHRVLPTQDDHLDPVVEMGLGRFRGDDVGRSVDARDDAVQLASFSRNHCDESTRESTGVREGHAAATVDFLRNRSLEAVDQGVDVA